MVSTHIGFFLIFPFSSKALATDPNLMSLLKQKMILSNYPFGQVINKNVEQYGPSPESCDTPLDTILQANGFGVELA